MGRRLLIALAACFALVAAGLAGVLVYLSNSINLMSDPPLARVEALPEGYDPRRRIEAYDGPHPRVAGRPEETFDFPIEPGEVGPAEPLFAGPLEYPFLCGENKVTREQPLVDNQEGWGVPVFAEEDGKIDREQVVGYSKDCLRPTQASYWYLVEGTEDFGPLEQADGDIATIEIDGEEVPFVVRVETGTINRYHYIIAALRGTGETLAEPKADQWNEKLIYRFRGGVGIGKRQGKVRASDVLESALDQLAQGYGIAYSSGTQTSIHYNMWRAEDTAARVKRQFTSLYGEPLYTVGIGGSGGAIQQYLVAQNHPGLLDAAIPLYSYPDMISQTIHVLDCEPLEYYFDVVDADNPLWRDWENRSWIQGLSADGDADNRFTQLGALASVLRGDLPQLGEGATECVKGWRGLTPLVHNPRFVHFKNAFTDEVAEQSHWSHWEDLKHIYGVDEQGYAHSTWDNEGVQYGLQALTEGRISADQFLHLNTHVGGWKSDEAMAPERFWLLAGNIFPVELSYWSHQNMHHSPDGRQPARRSRGDLDAMEAAYRSGHVFTGHADIPIIDLRHYLDEELDMHHATASFAARLRLQEGQGHADNQLIWMAHKDHDPREEALAMIDQWMANIRNNPNAGVAANKPDNATDQCFDAQGRTIAQGDRVWDGDWNGQDPGACTEVYPRHKTSREVAGASPAGNTFKCHLQPVSRAIERGLYEPVDMRPYRADLERIFPRGVCDHSRGDRARPDNLMQSPTQFTEEEVPAVIARALTE